MKVLNFPVFPTPLQLSFPEQVAFFFCFLGS